MNHIFYLGKNLLDCNLNKKLSTPFPFPFSDKYKTIIVTTATTNTKCTKIIMNQSVLPPIDPQKNAMSTMQTELCPQNNYMFWNTVTIVSISLLQSCPSMLLRWGAIWEKAICKHPDSTGTLLNLKTGNTRGENLKIGIALTSWKKTS